MIPERHAGESSLGRDFESLSVSKRLVRSVSQKLRKKNQHYETDEDEKAKGTPRRCLILYGRGGGCKVGADTTEEFGDPSGRRRSSATEEGKGYRTICGTHESGVDCFSYGMKDKFWKRNNNRKDFEIEETNRNPGMDLALPDEILEMCLVRLPMTSLMNARLVCKKWRHLTTTPRFMQVRREGSHQSPWLFLLGVVKDGFCSGEIHALDISLGQWHRVGTDILKGRFMFSVASIHEEIYVVGGCSSLTNFGKVDRGSFKTHKGVLVFSPMTKSWRKIASMKYARSTPILAISEISSDCLVLRNQQNWQERRLSRSRAGGVSDVYEDPHRLSVRRRSQGQSQLMASSLPNTKPSIKNDPQNKKDSKKFVLIAIGGLGSWDEPLDSGEIYDSGTNKWVEIPRLPLDFGIACSGVVCNSMFYVYSESDKLVGYDIERGFWVSIQTTPSPPRVHEYYPKLVSCNDRLFMLSVSWCEGNGRIGRRNKAVRKLWELNLVLSSWSEISIHPDAPMDWNASFVADRNLIFGVEMFKIFGQVLDFLTVWDAAGPGLNWSHVSRNHMAQELDASSCMTKSMAVMHL